MNSHGSTSPARAKGKFFSGWYIVGVGFLSQVARFGAPFFGFVHDVTGSYQSSVIAFVCALALSAILSVAVRGPHKITAER